MLVLKKGYFDAPKVLQIEITNMCPYSCPGCYKNIQMESMKFDVFKKIIDEAVELDVKTISLNGGEPMMVEELEAMIRYVNNRIPLATFISGYKLDEKWISFFREYNVRLYVSLNGSTDYINSNSREGYSKAIYAIELLGKNRFPYYINWVARHDNIKDFLSLLKVAKQMHAIGVNVVANKLDGNRKIQSPLTEEDYRFLMEAIQNDRNRFITIQRCFGVLIQEMGNRMTTFLDGCQAGISLCAIMVDGSYQPCTHLNYSEKYESILEYWNESTTLNVLRSYRISSLKYCEQCVKNRYCSFCRAMSKETHDNLKIGYKECPFYCTTS